VFDHVTYFMLPESVCVLFKINFRTSKIFDDILCFYYQYFGSSWDQ